ncbi:hypothetical protein GCM10009800_25260 [Nocardiopsis rhodophaea]
MRGQRHARPHPDALRIKIEQLRKVTVFGKTYDIAPREPPPYLRDDVARLEWQIRDIEWRRLWLNKVR